MAGDLLPVTPAGFLDLPVVHFIQVGVLTVGVVGSANWGSTWATSRMNSISSELSNPSMMR
jgi:hypothetical protein